MAASPQSLPVSPLGGGLINDTYRLGEHHVLQRLHPIFGAAVNDDIAALTPILRANGVPVPTLCPTRDEQPCTVVESDDASVSGVWRIMTLLDGETLHRFTGPGHAESAGGMAGRFHRALHDVQHDFAFSRPGAHDTNRHMTSVDEALGESPQHRLADDVRAIRDELHDRWAAWDGPSQLPSRIGHGDWKASNLLFEDEMACAVLDLDTMAWIELDVEFGDALRSWCNRAAEDSTEAAFDEAIFTAGVSGYVSAMRGHLEPNEVSAIVPGLIRICLELSARFAADSVRESYFGWNPAVAATRGDHNLLRSRGQLDLARAVIRRRAALESIVKSAFEAQ